MKQASRNIIPEISLNESLNDAWVQFPVTLTYKQTKALLKSLNQSVLFDSGADLTRGSYDILTGNPLSHYRIEKSDCSHGPEILPIYSRPFKRNRLKIPEKYLILPFVCGMIGYCSYEFGARIQINDPKTLDKSILPSAFFAHYTWSYVYDRRHKQGFVTFSPECSTTTRATIVKIINNCAFNKDKEETEAPKVLSWNKTQDFQAYADSFNTTLNYIKEGDCYQVNLAHRFECKFEDNSPALYFNLREKLNTPYSAYFSFTPDQNILCFSPEQFIGIKNKKVTTCPIKGTANNDEIENQQSNNAHNLQNSLKNQAENLMIVDLMRNDLSKICRLNSVKVNELFSLKTFKNVHHLISEVEGILKPELNEIQAFISCFPGGSITGAPKKRAMEIINELEKSGRDAYCGSIFYWNDDGQFDSNILIRTIVQSGKMLYCWGGGGIVNDSKLNEEYQESLIKVANLTGIDT